LKELLVKEGKDLLKNADLNVIAYSELILLMEARSNSGKVLFRIIKGFKSRDYNDRNAASAL
jgi:dihydroxyacetone kinase-like predicted kinase